MSWDQYPSLHRPIKKALLSPRGQKTRKSQELKETSCQTKPSWAQPWLCNPSRTAKTRSSAKRILDLWGLYPIRKNINNMDRTSFTRGIFLLLRRMSWDQYPSFYRPINKSFLSPRGQKTRKSQGTPAWKEACCQTKPDLS